MKTCTTLDPTILGFCIRETRNMSQDALAASSGHDVRTIQRTEAGNAVSVTTRRCLARGLGYDNPDIFDDPQFVANVHGVLEGAQAINQEALDKQHPEHVRVKTERVPNGAALGRFADLANSVMLTADDDISPEAKRAAAALFDHIRDLLDVGDDASYSDKLEYHGSLGSMLPELEDMGTAAYSAVQHVKLSGENWPDKTPLQITIGYLTFVPAQKALDAMFVPRRVPFLVHPDPSASNGELEGGRLPPPSFTEPRVRHRERGDTPRSFGKPCFPKALNQQVRFRLPAPSDPRRYRKGGIGLKHTSRRLTRLSITSEVGESRRETAVRRRIGGVLALGFLPCDDCLAKATKLDIGHPHPNKRSV